MQKAVSYLTYRESTQTAQSATQRPSPCWYLRHPLAFCHQLDVAPAEIQDS